MRGIVFDGTSTELVTGLELREPGPREVVVEMVAAGVCHSDLSLMNGLYGWPVPTVCGHEGAGVVAEVGQAVTHVKPGDHVIVATLAGCGFCEACTTGHPTSCHETMQNFTQPFSLDGEPVFMFSATSVFAERTLVRDVQCIVIPDDVPLSSAALVGCGVTTGMGAVFNSSHVQLGQTAAVFGVGGVGLNVIQALRVKGARRIVAIDTEPAKEPLARQFGATDFFDGRREDLVDAILALEPYSATTKRGPFNAGGLDWSYDCVAHPAVTSNAIECLDWEGTCVIIGVPAMGAEFSIPYGRLTHVQRTITGCRAGNLVPQRDFSLIIDLYRRGQVMLDELVSATFPLAQFKDAIDLMETGTAARSVLTF